MMRQWAKNLGNATVDYGSHLTDRPLAIWARLCTKRSFYGLSKDKIAADKESCCYS